MDIQKVAVVPLNMSLSAPNEEQRFMYPIKIMDELVSISKQLMQVSTENSTRELVKCLVTVDKQVQETTNNEIAYIPMLKLVGSADYNKIIRIHSNEAYPIPTFSRVLYYCVIEVIDARSQTEPPPKEPKKKKSKTPTESDTSDRDINTNSINTSIDLEEVSTIQKTTETENLTSETVPEDEQKDSKKKRKKEKKKEKN